MKQAIIGIVALMAAACAHGRTAMLPPLPESAEAAQVVVIRNDNLFGWGIAVGVLLDDVTVAHIRAGEHVALRLAPGFHRVGITDSSIGVAAEKGQTYYYLVSVDGSLSGFEIERLDAGRGREWTAKTRALP